VALVEVDIVGPEALERRVELLFYLGSREAPVGVAHREEQLGGEDVAVARAGGERFPEEALGGAATVDIGRVDEVDAQVERLVHAGRRTVALDAQAEGQPGAERYLGNL
jgi:uncharacterized glyoxalase superfamily protein PhnB